MKTQRDKKKHGMEIRKLNNEIKEYRKENIEC
jgi:hypothetical protein